MEYTIILFYKYVNIKKPENLRDEQYQLCEELGLTGRLIVAFEGINGTLEGTVENIERYISIMKEGSRFSDVDFKTSPGIGSAFPKLSAKVRSEIVTSRLGEKVDPRKDTGNHLNPDELHQWYAGAREFYIIDMRNNYEFMSGHFKDSISLGMKNFRELPEKLKNLEHLKNKTVVTFCTGGVRCEKASAYLKQKGFKDVHQLKGGIHHYIEKYPVGYYRGSMYVFDGRVTTSTATEDGRGIVGKCSFCEKKTEQYTDDDSVTPSCQVLCCDNCLLRNPHLRLAAKVTT